MRNLTVISKDINEYVKKLETLAQSKRDSEYKDVSFDTSVGVKFCVYVAIAVILSYVQFVLMRDSDVFVFAIAALICIIIALTFAFKCSHAYIPLRVAQKFAAIGFVMFLPCILSIFEFFKYKNETIVFPEDFNGIAFTYSVINKGEFPFFFFNNTVNDAIISWWFIVTLGCILPVFVFFLSFVIKCKKEYTKIKESQKKIAEIDELIAEAVEAKKELVKEEKDTKKECAELFETAKNNDDAECMKQLAALDYRDAKNWYNNYEKEQVIKEGERIYNDEISKDEPDLEQMTKAANLGNNKAILFLAKKAYGEIDKELKTEKENLSIYKKVINILENVKNKDGDALYLWLVSRAPVEGFNLKEWKYFLKTMRRFKEEHSISQEYYDNLDYAISISIKQINKMDDDDEYDDNDENYDEYISNKKETRSNSSNSNSYKTSNNYSSSSSGFYKDLQVYKDAYNEALSSSSSGCSSRWSDGTCHNASTSWWCSSCPYKGRENECYYSS